MYCYKITSKYKTPFIESILKYLNTDDVVLVKSSFVFNIYNDETCDFLNRPIQVEINKGSLKNNSYEICKKDEFKNIILQNINNNSQVRLRKYKKV